MSIDISKTDKKNVMVSYYGMTVNDVAEIWGADYILNDHLISGGWASIEYQDNRCPFLFCYEALDIPINCNGEEKLIGIITKPSADNTDFFVTDDINVITSYDNISAKLSGEYYIDELNGGHTFSCTSINNTEEILFTWVNSDKTPKITIKFSY